MRRGVTLPATLATAGLSGRLVSSATASATRFLSGSFALSPATQLADGVIRTMSRATILTAMGGVLVAASLATGVGWVAAQQGANPGGAANPPATVAATPKADPPAKPPTKTDGDAVAARVAADQKLRKLEQLADTLRVEIEAMERQIELLGKASGARDEARIAELQKHHAEIEEEYRRAAREVVKLETEADVLKKLLEDKNSPVVDVQIVDEEVSRDAGVAKLTDRLEKTKQALEVAVELKSDAKTIKELKADLSAIEQQLQERRKRLSAEVVEGLRAVASVAKRQRLAQLELDIQIKKAIRDKLKEERDAVKKQLDASTGGAVNVGAMRQALEPQREALAKVHREILNVRMQRDGVTFGEAAGAETKLDAILRELAALRKEVRELKEQKK